MISQGNAKTPHYIERVSFSSPEDVLQETLSKKYGEPFQEYRRRYFHSLDADKHGEAPDFAHTVTLEFVNRCNLTCGMCYVANHTFAKETLEMATVKNLIDQVAAQGKTGLLLGSGSEGLLYKGIDEVIRYAKDSGVMDVILMTNGTLLTPEMSEFIVKQEVSRVCISVDAATPETYEKVRGKNELDRVEKNIRGLADSRKKVGSALPIIRLSFCGTEDNQHEQEAFRDKWRDVVDYIDFQKVNDFSYVGREDEAELPDVEKDRPFCTKPFGYLNVWSSGDISPCCTFYGKSLTFGNIKDDTLAEVYDGEKMTDLRDQFLGKKELNKVCQVCLASRDNLIGDEVWS
ncbi:MAG: radical SAM protein [Rhodospirillales bacterium]|nr:radical SAM protein [Rhodospirillales bacterium]